MKILKLISGIAALGITVSANAADYQFVLADDSNDSKMCLAAVTNDKQTLKRIIYRSSENVREVARTLTCNKQIVANFAYQYGASETFAYLDPYTLKKDKSLRPQVSIKDIAATDSEPTIILIASNF